MVWLATVTVIFAACAACLTVAVIFISTGKPTITDWLREEPLRFWVPVAFLLSFVLGMAIHVHVW